MASNEYSYLVLGAGEVGPAAGYSLLSKSDTQRVIIVDASIERARAAMHKVASPEDIARRRCIAMHLDASAATDREIAAAFSGAHAIISAIPARFSPRLANVAASVMTHFCDLGGVTEISREMRHDRDLAARAKRSSIIHDCGLAPGLSGQMTAVLAHLLPSARRIITYVGGLPLYPTKDGFYWQRTFSAAGMVALLDPALILRNGILAYAPPCSEGREMDLPELSPFPTQFGETVQTRITAGAGMTPEIMQARGIKDCWEETIRWDWDALLGFLRDVPPDQRVDALERRLPHTGPDFPDLVVMRVVASRDERNAQYKLICEYDYDLQMSAMAKTTGFSVAAVARLAAQGCTPPGVYAPEELDGALGRQLIEDLATDLSITLSC